MQGMQAIELLFGGKKQAAARRQQGLIAKTGGGALQELPAGTGQGTDGGIAVDLAEQGG